MQTKGRVLVALAIVGLFLLSTTATASAGEINGRGERPMQKGTYPVYDEESGELLGYGQILFGKSECAFSGLNDEYLDEQPEEGPASDGFGRTQNWGQLPKFVRDSIGGGRNGPGSSCNPTSGSVVEP